MFEGMAVLIVEDEALIGLDLAWAIEDQGGKIVGPVATVEEALQLLLHTNVDAAVLDANLLDRDVTPVAFVLIEKHVPFVINSAIGIPDELRILFPNLPLVLKPASTAVVIAKLVGEIGTQRSVRRLVFSKGIALSI
jgi:two-component SAPR family response regulator